MSQLHGFPTRRKTLRETTNTDTSSNELESSKETIANLQHKIIILETTANSVEHYNRRNNIEITGIPENIGDKNLEHSVIEVIKAADIQIFNNDIEDCHRI